MTTGIIVGETKRGSELSYKQPDTYKYIWHACIDCGKERWVRISHKQPRSLRCMSCGQKYRKLCPICRKPAISSHHIKPRAHHGTDLTRNLIKLCNLCHDKVEEFANTGIYISPALIQELKRERWS